MHQRHHRNAQGFQFSNNESALDAVGDRVFRSIIVVNLTRENFDLAGLQGEVVGQANDGRGVRLERRPEWATAS